MRGGADVILRLDGQDKRFHAVVIENDPARISAAIVHYLGLFPRDAAYHDIRIGRDKSPDTGDLDRASRNSVVIEARPV